MVSRQQKRTLKEMEKTSTLASVLKVARMAILEDSSTTLSEPEKQSARVVQFPDEVQQSMRNRIKEKEAQLQIILELITELEDRALKTKRNEKHEVLLKCSEILQDYASEMLKEITR